MCGIKWKTIFHQFFLCLLIGFVLIVFGSALMCYYDKNATSFFPNLDQNFQCLWHNGKCPCLSSCPWGKWGEKVTCPRGNWTCPGRKNRTDKIIRKTGCLPFIKKIRKFRLKVKWSSNFQENPFRNCRLQNGKKLPYHLLNFPVSRLSSAENNYRKLNCKMVSANLFGWFADFRETLLLCNDHPNQFILPNSKHRPTIKEIHLTNSTSEGSPSSPGVWNAFEKNNAYARWLARGEGVAGYY